METEEILGELLGVLRRRSASADQKLAALEAAMLVVSADSGVGERIAREVEGAANA